MNNTVSPWRKWPVHAVTTPCKNNGKGDCYDRRLENPIASGSRPQRKMKIARAVTGVRPPQRNSCRHGEKLPTGIAPRPPVLDPVASASARQSIAAFWTAPAVCPLGRRRAGATSGRRGSLAKAATPRTTTPRTAKDPCAPQTRDARTGLRPRPRPPHPRARTATAPNFDTDGGGGAVATAALRRQQDTGGRRSRESGRKNEHRGRDRASLAAPPVSLLPQGPRARRIPDPRRRGRSRREAKLGRVYSLDACLRDGLSFVAAVVRGCRSHRGMCSVVAFRKRRRRRSRGPPAARPRAIPAGATARSRRRPGRPFHVARGVPLRRGPASAARPPPTDQTHVVVELLFEVDLGGGRDREAGEGGGEEGELHGGGGGLWEI